VARPGPVVANPASFRRGRLAGTGDQRTLTDAVGTLPRTPVNRGAEGLLLLTHLTQEAGCRVGA
jgi:hypothetical protein